MDNIRKPSVPGEVQRLTNQSSTEEGAAAAGSATPVPSAAAGSATTADSAYSMLGKGTDRGEQEKSTADRAVQDTAADGAKAATAAGKSGPDSGTGKATKGATPGAKQDPAAAEAPAEPLQTRSRRRKAQSAAAVPAKSGQGKAKAQGKAKVRRRWPAVVAGTATLAVVAAAVAAGTLYPGANATAQTEILPHQLPLGDATANCQGPTQLLAGSAEGADPEFAAGSSSTSTKLSTVVLSKADGGLPAAGVQSLDGAFTPLFTLSEEAAADANAKAVTGQPKMRAKVLRGQDAGAPSTLRIAPLGSEVPQSAGAVVVKAGDGDLMGLAAATCQAPSNDLWLTGASTAIGRTAVLSLSNSSPSPATVSLDLFSGQGPVQTAGGKGLVVAPGTVRQVVLAGLAPDQDLLSVNVKSTGGAVGAVIQQSVLRGLTPGGVDYIAPVQAPATELGIAGVRVQAPDAAAKISGQDGYADASTALLVTVPGASDAVVEVKAYGPKGQVALPGGGVVTATAGSITPLELKGLPAGDYSFSLTSDESVSAAVRMVNSTTPGEAVDVAYAPSTARLGSAQLMPVPADVSSSLVFTAPSGAATLRLVPIAEDGTLGTAKDLDLKAGTTLSVDPLKTLGGQTAAVLVSVAGAPTFGSQLLTTEDSADVAVLPIPGTTSGGGAITIITGW